MKGKYRSERKFRNRGDYSEGMDKVTAICDECGREIRTGEPEFVRHDSFGILRYWQGIPMRKIREKTTLCSECVQPSEVVKKDRKYVG